MVSNALYSKIDLLPPNKVAELLNFIDFLLQKEQKVKQERKPVFGCAKGKFRLSDDFDAPLEDFQEYMP